MTTATSVQVHQQVTSCEKEAYQVALDAYFYFYPLLTMDLTRRQCTNHPANKVPCFGPPNEFSHVRAYPDADFRTVVRPNFDTLYSSAWLDISEEPQIVSVPDANERYYLLPMLDMWTDVFAAPGWRTSGTKAQKYAVCMPTWKGTIPDGIIRINAPTEYVWIIGRTKTDGPDDYAAVHKFQDGMTVTPLSQWGKTRVASIHKIDPDLNMKTPPLDQINALKGSEYFKQAAQLLKKHAPHISDWSIISRIERIGLIAGEDFDASRLPLNIQTAIAKAAEDGPKILSENGKSFGTKMNGWLTNRDSMGVYGNNYMKRAFVTMVGLGANQAEDAVYPLNFADADGNPLDGNNNYVIHFEKDNLPPVDAFWSVTMYDKEGFQAANSLNRFAISSWMNLKKNADGSLDLYLQNANPGTDKESNWLPAPKCELGVTLRLYAPKLEVLNGAWAPPAIRKV